MFASVCDEPCRLVGAINEMCGYDWSMNRKTLAYAAIAVGLVLMLLSAFGDVIGVGSTEAEFGWKQILGLVVGAALIAAGLGMRVPRKPTGASASPQDADTDAR